MSSVRTGFMRIFISLFIFSLLAILLIGSSFAWEASASRESGVLVCDLLLGAHNTTFTKRAGEIWYIGLYEAGEKAEIKISMSEDDPVLKKQPEALIENLASTNG